MVVLKIQQDLREVKQKLKYIIDDTAKYAAQTTYVDNSEISSAHEKIGDEMEFYLKRAEDNGEIKRIQQYHEPLGFRVYAGKSSNNYVQFHAWNLSQIKFLSHPESVKEARNYNEFEIYGAYAYRGMIEKRRVKGTYNTVWDRINDLN